VDDDGAVTRPLAPALDDLRSLVGDGAGLVRAVATGHRRGMAAPTAERVEIHQVCLRSGPHLQAVSRTGPRVETVNAALGPAAATLVAGLLGEPFTTWHVETATGTVELRVTKRGEAQVHRTRAAGQVGAAGPVGAVGGTGGRLVDTAVPAAHDRVKRHLVPPEDPLFTVLGAGADKRRQVDAFVRLLAPSATALLDRSDQDRLLPDEGHPPVLRVADLGCGNAYLTFAAHRWLSGQAAEQGRAVHTVGVDVRADVVERSRRLAGEPACPGWSSRSGPSPTPTRSETRHRMSSSRCTPATRPATKPWPVPCGGRPRWSWWLPAVTTTSNANCSRAEQCSPFRR